MDKRAFIKAYISQHENTCVYTVEKGEDYLILNIEGMYYKGCMYKNQTNWLKTLNDWKDAYDFSKDKPEVRQAIVNSSEDFSEDMLAQEPVRVSREYKAALENTRTLSVSLSKVTCWVPLKTTLTRKEIENVFDLLSKLKLRGDVLVPMSSNVIQSQHSLAQAIDILLES